MTKDNSPDISKIERAYEYCETVTKLHAKSFYFAAKFLPKHKRKAVYPIYAFCRHVDDEIDEIGDEDNAKAVETVEIWKSNLQNLYENKDQEPKSEDQKTVFLAWSDLLKNYKIPQNLPIELIEGVLMDTHIKRYETFEKLYVYCYRVASTVGLMSSEILGYSDKIALEFAEKLGIAMQLTNILRDVKEDAERGRIYLPLEDLRRFNVSEQQILEGEFDDNFLKMMQFQIERAREFYREGEKGIPLLEKDSRLTVLLASRIYGRILDEIEKLDYNVFLRRAFIGKFRKILAIPKIFYASKRIEK